MGTSRAQIHALNEIILVWGITEGSNAMAFADPQSVTINAVAQTLARTSSGTNAGGFTKDDGTVILEVLHTYGARTRRSLRLTHKKIVTDPLASDRNIPVKMTTMLVVDTPVTGYTVAEQKQIVDALVAYLTASSGAKVTQLLGGEN